jgi:chitin disaccharide deacetylase
MLIVNADDLGRLPVATDRILDCHEKGRITSTSAMVFMRDSERAAESAIESGIDVGLHINCSERLTADSVPQQLREYHDGICRFLTSSKYALLVYNPFLRGKFRFVLQAQHAEFKRLYGREPSHLDGHQHMHLASNLLLDNMLPEGSKVRRSFSFRPGEKSLLNRIYRAAVDRRLARRHRLTDHFFALAQHFGPGRLERVMDLAKHANVELMTHPEVQKEYDFLMADEFGRALSEVRLAGYDAL